MRTIALTGGIGAGKSTVAALLRALGAHVVDADQLARDVVALGTPGHDAVVEAFGDRVLRPDGELDRPALASLVFADAGQRARLEAIVHPLVEEAAHQQFSAAPSGVPLVYEIPLLVESERIHDDWLAVIVVDAADDVRLARLTARGLSQDEARRRMAAQASRAARLARADYVLDNNGSPEELAGQVARLWPTLVALG